MLVFPQLTTGASALYPVTRRTERRTVSNVLADGSSIVYSDTDWAVRRWHLNAKGLRFEEMEAIEDLFDAARGPLETFTFLEPAGNLLARSEEFGAPEWDNDPLVDLTPGISDPFDGTGAMRVQNQSGAAVGGLKQTLAIPGDFRYAMSVWARGIGFGSAVNLTAVTAGAVTNVQFDLTTSWRRISIPVNLGQPTETVTFGASLALSATVELFGMQVEAQIGVSAYQRTGARGGVHAHARFAGPISAVRAQGTDVFDAIIEIVSKGS